MLVRDWMTENVITLNENDSVIKAMQLFKEHQIRRIPVVNGDKLVGIITDRDVKSITPPKGFSMDMYETYYIMSNLKIKDVMTTNPITVHPDDDIEKAAILMLENKISGLPVVDENEKVIGVITQTDIFNAFISMSGAFLESYKVILLISSFSDLVKLINIFQNFNISMPYLHNFLCWKEEDCLNEGCKRKVIIKFRVEDKEKLGTLKKELFSNFEVISFKET